MKMSTKITIILLTIFTILFGLSFFISKSVYDSQFKRINRPDPALTGGIFDYNEIKESYPRETISFKSGDNNLAGYLYGLNNDKGLIVVVHGLGGGADDYLAQIMYFVDSGFKVFAYDSTGCYDSEGDSIKGFPQAVLDLHHALNYIENSEELSNLDILLFGHSWGGYAVSHVLNYEHDITGVVSIAGVNNPNDFISNKAVDMLGGIGYLFKPFTSLYQSILYGEVASFTAVNGINKSNVPVMVIHGEDDETVNYKRDSIIIHQEKITNENAIFVTTSGIHGGHSNLFKSEDALNYINEVNKEYKDLYYQYNGKIPYDIHKDFYDKLDDELVSKLNDDLMSQIVNFYNNCLN